MSLDINDFLDTDVERKTPGQLDINDFLEPDTNQKESLDINNFLLEDKENPQKVKKSEEPGFASSFFNNVLKPAQQKVDAVKEFIPTAIVDRLSGKPVDFGRTELGKQLEKTLKIKRVDPSKVRREIPEDFIPLSLPIPIGDGESIDLLDSGDLQLASAVGLKIGSDMAEWALLPSGKLKFASTAMRKSIRFFSPKFAKAFKKTAMNLPSNFQKGAGFGLLEDSDTFDESVSNAKDMGLFTVLIEAGMGGALAKNTVNKLYKNSLIAKEPLPSSPEALDKAAKNIKDLMESDTVISAEDINAQGKFFDQPDITTQKLLEGREDVALLTGRVPKAEGVETKTIFEEPAILTRDSSSSFGKANLQQVKIVSDNIKNKHEATIESIKRLPEEEQIIVNAKVTAYEKFQAEIEAESKDIAKTAKKEATAEVEAYPPRKMIKELKDEGGIRESDMVRYADKDSIKELKRNHPGLITKEGTTLGEAVSRKGLFETVDDFLTIATRLKSKTKSIKELTESKTLTTERKINGSAFFNDRFDALVTEEEIAGFIKAFTETEVPKPKLKTAKEIAGEREFPNTPTGKLSSTIERLRDNIKALRRELGETVKAGKRQAKEAKKEGFTKGMDKVKELKSKLVEYKKHIRSKRKTDSIKRSLKKVTRTALKNPKNLPLEFREQIALFMREHMAIPKRLQKVVDLAPADSFETFIKSNVESYNTEVVDSLKLIKAELRGKQLSDMSVEELQLFKEGVDMLVKSARNEKTLLATENKQNLANTAVDLWEQSNKLPSRGETPIVIGEESLAREAYSALAKKLSNSKDGLFAAHQRMEFVFAMLDGNKLGGRWWRTFSQPLQKSSEAETRLNNKHAQMLEEGFAPLATRTKTNPYQNIRKWAKKWEQVTLPSGEIVRTQREKIFMIGMHSKNPENRKALLETFSEKRSGNTSPEIDGIAVPKNERFHLKDEKDLDFLVGLLTKKENAIIDNVIKSFKDLAPEADALSMELIGRRLELKDGYFPISRLKKNAPVKDEVILNTLENPGVIFDGRRKPLPSFIKSRTKNSVDLPIDMELDTILRGLREQSHVITHTRAIRDLHKLVNENSEAGALIKSEIERVMGKSTYKEIKMWVDAQTTGQRGLTNWKNRVLRTLRTNFVVQALGQLSTGFKQTFSLAGTYDRVNAKFVNKALKDLFNPNQQLEKFVTELSTEVKERFAIGGAGDRDIFAVAKLLNTGILPAKGQIKNVFFTHLKFFDKLTVLTTWKSAYEQALIENKGNIGKATEIADSVVRVTQPASKWKDLSRLQRGGQNQSEVTKLFTAFYSYFAVYQNILMNSIASKNMGLTSRAELYETLLKVMVIPAYLNGAVNRKRTPTAGEFLTDVSQMATGGIIGVRDATNFLTSNRRTFNPVPSSTTLDQLKFAINAVFKGEFNRKATFNTIGGLSGLPMLQVNKIVDAVNRLDDRDIGVFRAIGEGAVGQVKEKK